MVIALALQTLTSNRLQILCHRNHCTPLSKFFGAFSSFSHGSSYDIPTGVANVDKSNCCSGSEASWRQGMTLPWNSVSISWSHVGHLRSRDQLPDVAGLQAEGHITPSTASEEGFGDSQRQAGSSDHRTRSKSFRAIFWKDMKNIWKSILNVWKSLRIKTRFGILYNAPQSTSHSYDSYELRAASCAGCKALASSGQELLRQFPSELCFASKSLWQSSQMYFQTAHLFFISFSKDVVYYTIFYYHIHVVYAVF